MPWLWEVVQYPQCAWLWDKTGGLSGTIPGNLAAVLVIARAPGFVVQWPAPSRQIQGSLSSLVRSLSY